MWQYVCNDCDGEYRKASRVNSCVVDPIFVDSRVLRDLAVWIVVLAWIFMVWTMHVLRDIVVWTSLLWTIVLWMFLLSIVGVLVVDHLGLRDVLLWNLMSRIRLLWTILF